MVATIRALSQCSNVQVTFGAEVARVQAQAIALPTPPLAYDLDAVRTWRASGDLAALWLRYHQAALMPSESVLQQTEQMRVLLCGACLYKGVAYNAQPYMAQLPPHSLMAVLANYVLHAQLPSTWPAQAQQLLQQAAACLYNQQQFTPLMRQLWQMLYNTPSDADHNTTAAADDAPASDTTQSAGGQSAAVMPDTAHTPPPLLAPTLSDGTMADAPPPPMAATVQARPVLNIQSDTILPLRDYKIFSTAFDTVVAAAGLAPMAEQQICWNTIESHVQRVINETARAAAQVRRKLAVLSLKQSRPKASSDGILDTRALVRQVLKPDTILPLRQPPRRRRLDATVTLLVDNSGSMRGRPIVTAAACAYVAAQVIERAGAAVEVLGFTTADWRGGRSRKAWIAAGSPPTPGRLNDLLHIVYKNARTPLRRSKLPLALMVKDSLLKENIDGEALLFASRRLQRQVADRKILLVISDGAPADDSTLSTNHPLLLDKHLRAVVQHLENKTNITPAAIGIGHDVSRYYKHALRIGGPEQLGTQVLQQLAQLLEAV